MSEHERRIDYLEFPASDIAATKRFYTQVFGWKFTDYGPEYTSFHDGRLSGGFWHSAQVAAPGSGVLVVIYARDLHALSDAVAAAGGAVTREPFEFPGGRRFEFTDPSGNRLAVWSDQPA
ncbi:MAG: Glyoxalase-like domain protein [Nevskia sp.]|nr:Glyoxalase-like domain protein [Nevskia sp.]